MRTADLVNRVDQLLKQGSSVLSTRHYTQTYGSIPVVNGDAFRGFRTAGLSFIQRLYGADHPHYKEFDKAVHDTYLYASRIEAGIAVLKVIKDELEGGWLFTLRGLLTAEVFSDFLEMAGHFLENEFKDPAAVMAGSVLEEHLRQLCIVKGIPTEEETPDRTLPKKADRLNADLAKAEIYNKLDQKGVTSWLGIRNSAAHGKYDEYTKEQVRLMLQGVTDFMVRVPL